MSEMRVLHICSFFCGSKVHANLYRNLDALGVKQTVFACCRNNATEMPNKFPAEHVDFVYRNVLGLWDRIFYHNKIRKSYRELLQSVNPKSYQISHAVTLFGDGAVAYRLYKDYGVPYIVAVRSTDIDAFLAFAPHTWPSAIRILRNAQRIIFISKAPMEKFCRHIVIKPILPEIKTKFVIQPNGVDDYWVDHVWNGEKNHTHNIIYVGNFIPRKNVVRLIHSVLILSKQFPDIHLHLVGGGGWQEKKVLKLVEDNPTYLTYHGKIFDKAKLLDLYRQCSIFAMPSINETFGLVYIEALSQGLSVMYTKNQGIDGLLDERVGERVNAYSTKDIAEGLEKMLSNRTAYLSHEVVDFELFRWVTIAERYKKMYENC